VKIRKKLLIAATPVAALLLSDLAMAATSVALNISGRILPSSCDITLTGGGLINYGSLHANDLSAANNTVITPRMSGTHPTTTMNIACTGPALIGVKVTDNRAPTVNTAVLTGTAGTTALGASNAKIFGLGADGQGNNIGAFSITGAPANATVNGAPGKVIESADGNTWATSTGQFSNVANSLISWTSAAGTNAPEPVTTVAQVLQVQAAVVKVADLDTSAPTTLDGSVTFEVNYL
jgi:hypothetical protein